MIALVKAWRLLQLPDCNAIRAALLGGAVSCVDVEQGDFWLRAAARGKDPGAAMAGRTLFHGRIENAAEVAERLCIDLKDGKAIDGASLYDAALGRWGDEADRHLCGYYCTITQCADGSLRLARSPWAAPPLHFATNPERTIASNLMRAIFAGGQPREVDYDYVADQLIQDHHDGESCGWYRGVFRVPIGTIVRINQDGAALRRYYDPCALAPVRFGADSDYVEAANEQLDRAAEAAVAGSRKPGLMLSGGLDSALCATSILRVLPNGQKLPSFTFGPDADWDGISPPGAVGDERGLVRAFAAMHPRLEPFFPPPVAGGFDHRLRDMLAVTDLPTANVANIGVHHAAWQAARDHGCDRLLNGEMGNFTISNGADWSMVEDLLRLRWRQLYLSLRNSPFEARPMWRRFAAMPLMAVLPRGWRDPLRRMVGANHADRVPLFSLLSDDARERYARRARLRGTRPLMRDYALPRSREEWIWQAWHSCDSGEDLDQGFERLYGIERRDITAYRPLVEFCLALPTGQLRRGGEHRWLARRMAYGTMPEEQRRSAARGAHNADWHTRMSRRRTELLDYAERMREHPFLRETIDLDRMKLLLQDWPEATPVDPDQAMPRSFAITRALTAAAFIGHAEGRNDL